VNRLFDDAFHGRSANRCKTVTTPSFEEPNSALVKQGAQEGQQGGSPKKTELDKGNAERARS